MSHSNLDYPEYTLFIMIHGSWLNDLFQITDLRERYPLIGIPDQRSHITRKNGCMRSYSARAMERNIGRYSKLIKSRVLSGKNAGNVVERLAIR
ncbi:hypothetical protein BDB01DRAFT_824845, partial [Pilobolus umbonatus]